jgi:hypothetical protein
VTELHAGQEYPATNLRAQYDPFSEARRNVVDVLSDHEASSSVGASAGFSDVSPEARRILEKLPLPAETGIGEPAAAHRRSRA